jgi:hypothetical protein
MSKTENYIKLINLIAENEQDTEKLNNKFIGCYGELNSALGLNPELSFAEHKFLGMAIAAVQSATNLIFNLRTEINNKNVLIKSLDETFGDTYEVLIEKDSKIAKETGPRNKGTESTKKNRLIWEEFICDSVKKYFVRNRHIVSSELEHHVRDNILEAKRSGIIKMSSGGPIDAPANAPVEVLKVKIKLACKKLGKSDPYPTRNKKTLKG